MTKSENNHFETLIKSSLDNDHQCLLITQRLTTWHHVPHTEEVHNISCEVAKKSNLNLIKFLDLNANLQI